MAAETSDRIPKWLLPVIRGRLLEDGDIRCSAAIVASWARYAEAVGEDGQPIDLEGLRSQLDALNQDTSKRISVMLMADSDCPAKHVVALLSLLIELGDIDYRIAVSDDAESAQA